MAIEFGIRAWAACAPALQSREAWQAWSQAPWLPEGSDLPTLAAMAPMLRRRVNAIGRAALHPAYDIAPDTAAATVFASRHGDTRRAFEMLSALAAGEPLSPTAFGLSVHNAIGAMFTIDRGDASNLLAVAAGRDTVETAVVEACGLLADGADEVLLVCYDAPLPEAYAEFADEPGCLFGWAWRIGKPRAGEPVWRLDVVRPLAGDQGDPDTAHPVLPHALDVLRFMLAGEAVLTHRGERAIWRWQRRG
ncbi:beta-ketoacyl synthase chain length factor [Cupriavidus campinensis]